MRGVSIYLALGTGKARCQLCHEMIGKHQPCIKLDAGWMMTGYVHGIAAECPCMIQSFKLKV